MSNNRVLLVTSLFLSMGWAHAMEPVLHVFNSSSRDCTVTLNAPGGEIHAVKLELGECIADEGGSSCLGTADPANPLQLRGVDDSQIQQLDIAEPTLKGLRVRFSSTQVQEELLLSQNT